MSDFNWCHGPECHKSHTLDRIRGVKGSKVLRTKKVTNRYSKSMYGNGGTTIWDYFCNHRCLMDYMAKHTQAVINIEPRNEPLETPILDPQKVKHRHEYSWGVNEWTNTEIKVDESRQM
tara:strand:- start:792 stop:1148 length:357 start_codon:yes stop_codon:yes gene_type:complete